MRTIAFAVLTLAAGFMFAANETVPPSLLRTDAPALEIAVSVRPTVDDEYQPLTRTPPGSFRCSAYVYDEPGSKRVWKSKDIVILPGESGEETSTVGPLSLRFAARIAKNRDYAETVVTVTRDGKVINRQRSTVWLRSATR